MRDFWRENEVVQKACMQHEGCYKYSITGSVRLCVIIQKETKVAQNFLTHLCGEVKEAVTANSLTSKKGWRAWSNWEKRNTYRNNRSNVKRKRRDLNQKGQN